MLSIRMSQAHRPVPPCLTNFKKQIFLTHMYKLKKINQPLCSSHNCFRNLLLMLLGPIVDCSPLLLVIISGRCKVKAQSYLICLSVFSWLCEMATQEKLCVFSCSAIGRVYSHHHTSCIFKTTRDKRQAESNEVTPARQRLCTELPQLQKIRRPNAGNRMGKALCVN